LSSAGNGITLTSVFFAGEVTFLTSDLVVLCADTVMQTTNNNKNVPRIFMVIMKNENISKYTANLLK